MQQKVIIRKAHSFSTFYKKIFGIIATLVVVASIPLTVYLLNQSQDIRQNASAGNRLPQTNYLAFSGSSPDYRKDFTARNLDPEYATAPYRLAVECFNKAYEVTQGYDVPTCQKYGLACTTLTGNEGYFGGSQTLTRKFAVAFIVHYHNKVIQPGQPGHWDYVTPTGIFADMPAGANALEAEVETAVQKGFITTTRTCADIYGPTGGGYPPSAKCFDPDSPWMFDFYGIDRSDYFSADGSAKNPLNETTRGSFINKLYTYGINPAHQDLDRCLLPLAAPTATPVPPTIPPTVAPTAVPACGTACTSNQTCAQAGGGCNTCNSTTGKCSVAACNVSCSKDSDCAGAATKDGCVSCVAGKCAQPFNAGACHCDGIDATAIGSGQAVTFSAYSKVEGADTSLAMVKGVNIRVFRGGAEVANQVAQSGFLTPLVIENTAAKVRYKTDWKYTVPADAENGDLFRVQADMQCVPKTLAVVPAVAEKSLISRIVDKVTEPIRVVLGASIAPSPTPPTALQINSFYPGEITDRKSCYLQFQIKK